MADLPIALPEPFASRLVDALDAEEKIVRGLDALGPIADRDVVIVGGGAIRAARLAAAGARVEVVDWQGGPWLPLADASADVIVSFWSEFRGVDRAEVDEAERVLRSGGRLLVVHDYGRDDVSALRGSQPEYGSWSRRDGEFLRSGFRIRVLHCWWTFADLGDAVEFLSAAFGAPGVTLGTSLRRPRLSYNVAIYHRSRPIRDKTSVRVAVGTEEARFGSDPAEGLPA